MSVLVAAINPAKTAAIVRCLAMELRASPTEVCGIYHGAVAAFKQMTTRDLVVTEICNCSACGAGFKYLMPPIVDAYNALDDGTRERVILFDCCGSGYLGLGFVDNPINFISRSINQMVEITNKILVLYPRSTAGSAAAPPTT